MKLKELMEVATIDRVWVLHRDKQSGKEVGRDSLILLPSQFAEYGNTEVNKIELCLDTSRPSYDGSIQVKPILQAIVLHYEG